MSVTDEVITTNHNHNHNHNSNNDDNDKNSKTRDIDNPKEQWTPSVSIEEQKDGGRRPECFGSTIQECLFVLTATMAIGQNSFFTGSITGVTASIGRELDMNSAEITWISAGAALSSGAFLLTFGKLADLFGRKKLFIVGMAGFTLALVVAGFATSAIYMDVFSGILGLFSAAVVPPAVGALGVVYEKPSKRKNRAFACFSAGNPLGFVGGMIISGIADHVANWRASFWALAVLYAIFTILTVWTVPSDGDGSASDSRPAERWSWEGVRRCDLLGMALVVVGVSFFSSALSLAGDAPHGWNTPYVIVLLVLGIIAISLFLYWQSVFSYPLMPLYVWRDRNFSLLMAMLCLGFMGFMGSSFWLSLYLQNIKGLSALEIAAQLLPMVVNGILVNIICGLVLHKVSNKLLMLVATIAYTASFLILSFMKEDSPYWAFIFPSLILVVVGADIEFNVANMYVMSSLPSKDQSLAGGIFNTVTKLCGNLSLGITTAVYNSVHNDNPASGSIRPYLSTFWFAAVVAGLSMFLVPFLDLGTQGGNERKKVMTIDEKVRSSAILDDIDPT